ncbi:MAG: acyltransferase [Clostridia bacterium]|nr:acyltransferase [Clostridia bacterium]
MKKGKSNKAFMLLSALAIIFVVDSNCGKLLSVARVFPYDSYLMPMLVFISGYFFREEDCTSRKAAVAFMKNKVFTQLLPFLGWTLFYGVVTVLLTRLGVLNFAIPDFLSFEKTLLFFGISFGYSDPAWIIPVIFTVNIMYCLSRSVFKKVWNDIAAMAVMAGLGAFAVYLAANGLCPAMYEVFFVKLLFFLQFFELGVFFKKYLEKAFDRVHLLIMLPVCIGINLFLLWIYGTDIAFPNCTFMIGFKTANLVLPLITSVTGIAFYLKLCKALTRFLGESRLIRFISDNTFFIMINHLGCKAIVSLLFYFGGTLGIRGLQAVDLNQLRTNAWYIYLADPVFSVVGLCLTIVLVVLACFAYTAVKGKLKACFALDRPDENREVES